MEKNKKSLPVKDIKINEAKKMPFVKQILCTVAIALLLLAVFKENKGYNWLWNDLIHENLKFINKNKNLNYTEKMQAKFGADAALIEYIKKNTPDNAVIAFPAGDSFLSANAPYKFIQGLGGIKVRVWTQNFLYPRTLVYEHELKKWKNIPQITHVVCMNGWGYDQLEYEVQTRNSFDVLPVKYTNRQNLPMP
ncbi:MAG: hypothetical protein NW207_12865 [Cytophagales bacterium]|nr:hypothetical protein [Cytophagales bacterium]